MEDLTNQTNRKIIKAYQYLYPISVTIASLLDVLSIIVKTGFLPENSVQTL